MDEVSYFELEEKVVRLETLLRVRDWQLGLNHGDTVIVPDDLRSVFDSAQEVVGSYFAGICFDPEHASVSVGGDRYVLVQASDLSVNFFNLVKNLYFDRGVESIKIAQNMRFDFAHILGLSDAKNFHKKMNLIDPVSRLSAGPVHFAHTGWAKVDILPESVPSSDENFFLMYRHPYSFESDSWLKEGKLTDFPVCSMNAGYSSGWCEESFGVELTSVEVSCKAMGDKDCTFIMAPPNKIEEHLKKRGFFNRISSKSYFIPSFFEQKKSEEKLRAALGRLENGERIADLAYWEREVASGITYWSDNHFKMFGIEPKEGVTFEDDFLSRVHPDDVSSILDADSGAVSSGEKIDLEFRIRRADNGEERILHSIGEAVIREGDVSLCGVLRDVTEEKNSKNLLDFINGVLLSFTESQNWGYASGQVLGAVLRQTQSEYGFVGVLDGGELRLVACEGVEFGEQKGLFFDLFEAYKEDGYFGFKSFDNLFGVVVRSKEFYIANDPVNDLNSKGLPVGHPELKSFMGVPIVEGGELKGVVGVANTAKGFYVKKDVERIEVLTQVLAVLYRSYYNDVKRKKVKVELQRSNKLYDSLVNSSIELVYRVGVDGNYEFANDAYLRRVGVSLDELVGQRYGLGDYEKAGLFFARVKAVVDSGVPVRFEYRSGRDGRFFQRTVSPVFSSDGKVESVTVFSVDITEVKMLEERVARCERLASFGTLLAGIAHELNNPLTSVIGNLYFITKHCGDVVSRRRAVNAQKEAERCAKIIRDVTDVVRGTPSNKELFGLDKVLTDLLVDKRGDYGGVSFSWDFEKGLNVEGYKTRVCQAVINLVNNSYQAFEGGEKKICVSGRKVGGEVVLSVSDNGPGMSEEVKHNAFEAFYTTKEVGKGMGLGLYLVHSIVEEHGGRVELESSLGEGTVFNLYFPCSVKNDDLVVYENLDCKVLVVDDEFTVREITCDYLEMQGCVAENASGGGEALELLVKNSYDVILCDMSMPEVDGREVYYSLKKLRPELCNRFVVMTGDAMRSSTDDFLKKNGVRVLAKPFNFEDIKRLVYQVTTK